MDGRSPCEQVVPGQVQVHQRLLSGDVERTFEAAGDPVVLKNALLIPRRVPLYLLRPLTDVVEMMYPHASVIVVDTAHDVIAALRKRRPTAYSDLKVTYQRKGSSGSPFFCRRKSRRPPIRQCLRSSRTPRPSRSDGNSGNSRTCPRRIPASRICGKIKEYRPSDALVSSGKN